MLLLPNVNPPSPTHHMSSHSFQLTDTQMLAYLQNQIHSSLRKPFAMCILSDGSVVKEPRLDKASEMNNERVQTTSDPISRETIITLLKDTDMRRSPGTSVWTFREGCTWSIKPGQATTVRYVGPLEYREYVVYQGRKDNSALLPSVEGHWVAGKEDISDPEVWYIVGKQAY